MHTGIMLPNGIPQRPPQAITEWAVRAEERGFDSLGVIERVEYDCVDPLVALGAAAAVTHQIRLTTDVLVAPLRSPRALRHQALAVQHLSRGRLTLGLGVGIREDDFTAVGASYRGRGRRFEEQLQDLSEHFVAPLVVGGEPRLAAPRAARWGIGWTAAIGGPDQVVAGREALDIAWAEAGRTDRPHVTALVYAALGHDADRLVQDAIGSYYAWLGPDLVAWIAGTCVANEDALATAMQQFADAGADELMIVPCSADLDQLDRIADVALDITFDHTTTALTTGALR